MFKALCKTNCMTMSSLIAAALLSTSAMADEEKPVEKRIDGSDKVSVVWVNPKDFTDVRPSSEGRKRFRERTMKDLYKYIDKLAADLPEGHKLKLNVTDVDLAGQVWPGMMMGFTYQQDMRIVRQIDIPRIDFSFELLNGSGNVVKSGEEELTDMAFQQRAINLRGRESLAYEKNMLKRWFKKEFKDELAANQDS